MRNSRCPNCGQKQAVREQGGISTCSACGVTFNSDTLTVHTSADGRAVTPGSILSLGKKGTLDSHSLEVVGYIRYKESDDEDTWYWEEWLCLANKDRLWIQYEEETYTLYTEVRPPQPIDTRALKVGRKVRISDTESFTIRERGTGTVTTCEGTLPWDAEVGETSEYADGSYRTVQYSVEWDEVDTEVYKGRVVDIKELLRGFGMQAELVALEEKERKAFRWKPFLAIMWIVTIASIAAAVYAAIRPGTLVYGKQVTLCHPDAAPNSCIPTPLPLGPFTLTKQGRAHKVVIESLTASQQNWHSVDVTLLSQDQAPVSAFAGDFWSEYWKEGNESGVESNYQAKTLFRLDTPGVYHLDLELQREKGTTPSDQFRVMVYENVILSRYFVAVAGVALSLLSAKDKSLQRMLRAFG